MRIQNCPTQEVGAVFFKKSTDRHAKNPDGTRRLIKYEIVACKSDDIRPHIPVGELIISGRWVLAYSRERVEGTLLRRDHPGDYWIKAGFECDGKFATTGNRYLWSFVDENFCEPCRAGALDRYIIPWAVNLTGVRNRDICREEQSYIWHNYVIPFGAYTEKSKLNFRIPNMKESKLNYWERG